MEWRRAYDLYLIPISQYLIYLIYKKISHNRKPQSAAVGDKLDISIYIFSDLYVNMYM